MIILISTEQMRVKIQGNGETKNFSFPFLLNKKTDLLVRTWDGETLRTVTDWTVEPVNGIWPTTGGTVVYPLSASPVASNITVIIERDIDIIQSDSYQRNDSLSMTSLERTFDSNVQRIQEVQDRALRAVVLPVQSDYEDIDPRLPIPKPNMGFYWDETGTKLVEGMNPKEATERAEAAAAAAKQSEENAAASAERTEELAEKVFEGIDEAKQAAKDAKASAEDAAESAEDSAKSAEDARKNADDSYINAERAAQSATAAKVSEISAAESADRAEAAASTFAQPLVFKGGVENYGQLPVDPSIGDVWFVEQSDETHGIISGNYVWNGAQWIAIGNGAYIAIATDAEIEELFFMYRAATDPEIIAVCESTEVDVGEITIYDKLIPYLFSGGISDLGDPTAADDGVVLMF